MSKCICRVKPTVRTLTSEVWVTAAV
uniref:Uncharacterized protein n=1 Tax=Anguilla anguilla TaxID=7936 RepID=A0A0E9VWG8_ANGAN